jgi:hypothetical protein
VCVCVCDCGARARALSCSLFNLNQLSRVLLTTKEAMSLSPNAKGRVGGGPCATGVTLLSQAFLIFHSPCPPVCHSRTLPSCPPPPAPRLLFLSLSPPLSHCLSVPDKSGPIRLSFLHLATREFKVPSRSFFFSVTQTTHTGGSGSYQNTFFTHSPRTQESGRVQQIHPAHAHVLEPHHTPSPHLPHTPTLPRNCSLYLDTLIRQQHQLRRSIDRKCPLRGQCIDRMCSLENTFYLYTTGHFEAPCNTC